MCEKVKNCLEIRKKYTVFRSISDPVFIENIKVVKKEGV